MWSHTTDDVRGPGVQEVPIPDAAGKSAVQVRFHYTGSFAYWWEVDDVTLGLRNCTPVHGGLLIGNVTDKNTGAGITGVTVASKDAPADTAVTAATPDDPAVGDGFFHLFSTLTGSHDFTATKKPYQSATATANVLPDYVTTADFSLASGHLTVGPASITKKVAMGATAAGSVTVTNDGSAPAAVQVGEQDGGFTILSRTGAPRTLVHGHFSTAIARHGKQPVRSAHSTAVGKPAANPSAEPWTALPDYPDAIQDSGAAALDGKVYVIGGYDGAADTAGGNVLDSSDGSWTAIAPMSTTREKPSVAFLGGKMYVVGGWGPSDGGAPVATLEIYDPASDSWTTGADDPDPMAAQGVAVLGGKLYVVGGCPTGQDCGATDTWSYDPAADAWTQLADYPHTTSWASCGSIGANIYCAGGSDANQAYADAYSYSPADDSWTQVADMPADLWGGGSIASGGKLLISGGVTGQSTAVTNAGYAYDPSTDSWSDLPNSNNSVFRGASACGFDRIGGNPGGAFVPPVASAEQLPGFDQCDATTDVSWLSATPTTFTLAPGKSQKVSVGLDASGAAITQPGTYAAKLAIAADTPTGTPAVDVTMNVTPPTTWGKVTGTITGVACDGSVTPLPGATVELDSWATSYTLKTDKDGGYALWLDKRNNPLSAIVAKDGWKPQTKAITIVAKKTTTANFALKIAKTCS